MSSSSHKLSWFLKLSLIAGLLFLYIPLFILVIYSFNDSKLVTVWGGFSTKWYGILMGNDVILNAAWLSIKLAAMSSLAAGSWARWQLMPWRASSASKAQPCLQAWCLHRW